jgi:hypothetical protein
VAGRLRQLVAWGLGEFHQRCPASWWLGTCRVMNLDLSVGGGFELGDCRQTFPASWWLTLCQLVAWNLKIVAKRVQPVGGFTLC